MHYELRVIGNPVAHSKSPFIHHEFAKQAKLSVNYEKVLSPIEEFSETLNHLASLGVLGANVTLPFKEQAFSLAHTHSERAKRAKAANTLCFRSDGLYADNTDGMGLVTDIEKVMGYALKNKRLLILGAGGAVRGILFPIIESHPHSITVVNRNKHKASLLAHDFQDVFAIETLTYEELAHRVFDVIIDGTSFSTEPLPLPDTLSFAKDSLAYDLKYYANSSISPQFLNWAKQQGAHLICDGMGMLVEQAAAAFTLWTGFSPNTHSVRLALTLLR